MNAAGNRVSTPVSETREEHAGSRNPTAGATPAQTRQRGLSFGRVSELITDLMGRRFYGKLALHFEAGHIVCAKLEQSIKE